MRALSWAGAIAKSQCKPDTTWKDPIQGRSLLKGEFGCAVSHLRTWEKIAASGLNGVILEEDVIFDNINPDEVDRFLKTNDSVWLGYRWNSLGYWYNCHAYAITPKTAGHLIDGYRDAIIPCDEWVPAKLKEKNNYFYPEDVVKQIPRATRPSTIEGTEMLEILEGKKTDFRIITIATEPEKMWALKQSAEKFGVEIVNLGKNHPWRDDMQGMGGFPKIQLVNEYLATVPANAVVMFMDGYDTFLADEPEVILSRFLDMKVDILFGAEANLWPLGSEDPQIKDWPETGTKYKYLNSGLYIGHALALHSFVSQSVSEGDSLGDDQLFCQRRYLSSLKNDLDFSVKLDFEGYIFQNDEPNIKVHQGQIWNAETNCCGCVYHGNGGPEAKDRFVGMAEKFGFKKGSEQVSPYYMKLDYEEVAKDILVTDFLTPVQCDYLIQKSEGFGNWGKMDGDKFPAQEIRLKKLGLWYEYERFFKDYEN